MLIKACKHLEQWDSCLSIYIFPRLPLKITRLRMREHLAYQRFRVWYCSLPAYPPTCLSCNLCIFTILTPTLTHSQAFVLMSPLPNHLSLSPPSPFSPAHTLSLHRAAGVEWLCLLPPPPFYPSLSLRLSFPFSLSFYGCLALSLAAGRRREDAITAAHEGGGWVGGSTQGKQLQSPQGCQLQSPQLWRFLTRQTEGKLLQS